MYPSTRSLIPSTKRYIQFGVVGASGVLVDMAVLFALADPLSLHWDLSLSKVLAAEAAILSNFTWNELWTFRDLAVGHTGCRARAERLGRFNLICAAGIGMNVLLLNLQVRGLGMSIYFANMAAILTVSLWNFGMNLKFGWPKPEATEEPES